MTLDVTSPREQSTPYLHVQEKFRHVMGMTDADRLAFIEADRWIGYDRAQELVDLFTHTLNAPTRVRPRSYLLVGEPNNGKTTVVRHFEKLCGEPYVDADVEPIKPLIVTEQPTPDEKGFYASILDCFWVPYKATSSALALRNQAVLQLRRCKTRLILIDEFHSLLAGSPKKQREVMNAIKYLSNVCSLPIIGVGTARAVQVLHTDPQHSSRFEVLDLPLWQLDPSFQKLLAGFEKVLPLKKRSGLSSPEMATLLHRSSGGNLGNLKMLLATCAREAIEKGGECITTDMVKSKGLFRPTERR